MKKIMFFYIFTYFFIFFFLMKFLGALPQAPSAVCLCRTYVNQSLFSGFICSASEQICPFHQSHVDVGHAAFHECHGTDDGDECRLVVPIE